MMLPNTNHVMFIFILSASVFILYLLTPMLTPFLLGALLAYLTNPLVKRLEKWHVPHLLSVISIFLFVFCAILLLIFVLLPIIQEQLSALINAVPSMISWLQEIVLPWVKKYVNMDAFKAELSANASSKTAWVFHTVLKSGNTLLDWLVTLLLTPVITFYLLRDWDAILKAIQESLPQSIKPTTIKLAKECDEVLGAFFRGQLLVMLSLCFIYGIGLTVVGVQGGFIIGVIGGLLSIVPYLGSIFIVITASITALVQYGDWHPVLWVLVVYLVGQIIEAYVLTPYFIGNRIGLHSVAVIFAIMVGGTLFGFFGVLAALPVAAVIMVILQSIKQHYQLTA